MAGKLEGVDIVADSAENVLVGVADVSLFAQNFVIAAESMGYGICYIGGVRNKPSEISELFNLPDHVFPLFGLTIGVPARRNEVKPRLPVSAVLHENEYNVEKYEELLPATTRKWKNIITAVHQTEKLIIGQNKWLIF